MYKYQLCSGLFHVNTQSKDNCVHGVNYVTLSPIIGLSHRQHMTDSATVTIVKVFMNEEEEDESAIALID